MLLAGISGCSSFNFCSSSSRSSLWEGDTSSFRKMHLHSLTTLWPRLSCSRWGKKNKNTGTAKPKVNSTYSPGPGCGNGITLLVEASAFTVPAIWAIRSCHLWEAKNNRQRVKFHRLIRLTSPDRRSSTGRLMQGPLQEPYRSSSWKHNSALRGLHPPAPKQNMLCNGLMALTYPTVNGRQHGYCEWIQKRAQRFYSVA